MRLNKLLSTLSTVLRFSIVHSYPSLLSVLLGIICSKIAEETLTHGISILYDAILLRNLILFSVITPFIGSLLIIGLYMSLRGGYSSTFTLVFGASNLLNDWRGLLKSVITKLEAYQVYNVNCREVEIHSGAGYEHFTCHSVYKGSTPLEMKLHLFKPTENVILLTVTPVASPFRVIVEELRNGPFLNKLRAWRKKVYYMELDIWYATIEDLDFYFDDLVKAFSRLETPLMLIDIIYQ